LCGPLVLLGEPHSDLTNQVVGHLMENKEEHGAYDGYETKPPRPEIFLHPSLQQDFSSPATAHFFIFFIYYKNT
jgi:hypothetical protein